MPVYLVTGASGFLGAWVCDYLLRQGAQVIGYCRQPRADVRVSSWRQGDITDLEALTAAVQGCDAVIHLAVRGQTLSLDDPETDLRVNALGTLQALRAARAAGVRRFVYTSSSAVYGSVSGHLNEETPLQPLTPYGVSKAAAEAYCGLFARSYGLHTVVLRLFNLYGPTWQGKLRPTVEGLFVQAVRRGQPPTILGDPDRAFDFVHVADILPAIWKALHARPAARPRSQPRQRAKRQPAATGELVYGRCRASTANPSLLPGPAYTPPQVADLKRAQLLDYAPRTEMKAWVHAAVTAT